MEGRTALHHAAFNEHETRIWTLLEHGMNVAIKDYGGGEIALHKVADCKQEALARMLLEHGANADIKYNQSRTVLDLAIEPRGEKTVRLLESWIASY